jgi:hypothetical protein
LERRLPKKPKEPRDWWIRHDDDWQPIKTLPDEGGPFVLANADKTKTWLSDGANATPAESHTLFLEEGHPEHAKRLVDGDEPAFWAHP